MWKFILFISKIVTDLFSRFFCPIIGEVSAGTTGTPSLVFLIVPPPSTVLDFDGGSDRFGHAGVTQERYGNTCYRKVL
jgi:hypothetical protein